MSNPSPPPLSRSQAAAQAWVDVVNASGLLTAPGITAQRSYAVDDSLPDKVTAQVLVIGSQDKRHPLSRGSKTRELAVVTCVQVAVANKRPATLDPWSLLAQQLADLAEIYETLCTVNDFPVELTESDATLWLPEHLNKGSLFTSLCKLTYELEVEDEETES